MALQQEKWSVTIKQANKWFQSAQQTRHKDSLLVTVETPVKPAEEQKASVSLSWETTVNTCVCVSDCEGQGGVQEGPPTLMNLRKESELLLKSISMKNAPFLAVGLSSIVPKTKIKQVKKVKENRFHGSADGLMVPFFIWGRLLWFTVGEGQAKQRASWASLVSGVTMATGTDGDKQKPVC